MSPRRAKRSTPPDRPQSNPSNQDIQEWAGEEYVVRSITGSSSTKNYRCPGCDQEIRPATPHVVAWPHDRGMEERRHWHTPCWKRRESSGPRR
ncbi:MAG TPA: ATP/GTP-binding protein [Actinobacteria bacterium]|nr:ATP/GTP-binding protein [Actinomycetota bacterium]